MIRLEVLNDRTGTTEIGNYDVQIWGRRMRGQARVERFDRRLGPFDLLRRAIDELEEADRLTGVSEIREIIDDVYKP